MTPAARDIDGFGPAAAADPAVADFVALLKPRVMSLVVLTGFTGMALAPGVLPVLGAIAILCIAVGAGAAGAFNMWYERDIDGLMRRTAHRPLPAGRMGPDTALAFAVTLAVAAVTVMGLATNVLAALLLAGAIAFYALVYTVWLKRRTPQNIVIGGAAGAFPPLIGWAAVTGGIDVLPLLLFLVIFLWTPPHFWSLALHRSEDYAKAGVPMLPVVAGAATTRRHIVGYAVALLPATLAPAAFGLAGPAYGVGALALGVVFVAGALRVAGTRDTGPAVQLFGYSILHLAALFALLLVDRGVA